MSEPEIIIKPNMFAALLPDYLKYLFRFGISSVLAYWLLVFLIRAGIISINTKRLTVSLIIMSLLLPFIAIKPRIVRMHSTKYFFYDTHVVEQIKFIVTRRNSIPYRQINKISNKSSLWDRITRSGDIILQTNRASGVSDMVIKSVPDADEVEDRIYNLIRRDSHYVKKQE